ncbi:hypothetical protein F4679DRAFT_250991 [Xylaria curta]|nr:hypothetical protein F4679DRAFT_250991 [Xylaria curta]
METDSDASSSSEPEPVLGVPDPVRILVETTANLVSGQLYEERVEGMRNVICQYHWGRDFDDAKDRGYVYGLGGAAGDLRNAREQSKVCFFLVDSGETMSERENPPVLRYRWTGKKLYVLRLLEATSWFWDEMGS